MQFKSSIPAVMAVLALTASGYALPSGQTRDSTGDPIVTLFLMPNYMKTGNAIVDNLITWSPDDGGEFNTCYQIPWQELDGVPIGSVLEGEQTAGCWIYPWDNTDCSGTDFTAVDATQPGVANGDPSFDLPASSIQCLPWTT